MGRIAFIAPYGDILVMGKRVINELGLADKVDCHLGLNRHGLDVALKAEAAGADVIVTRGGTAEIIEKAGLQVPVVEIPVTVQDLAETLLQAKKMADIHDPKIAVMAFKNMMRSVEVLSKVMDMRVAIYQLNDEAEIEPMVEQVIAEGADIIIGGIQTTTLAAARGVKTLLLASGEDSYRAAILQAEKVSYSRALEKERMQKFRVLIDYSVQGIIAIDGDGRISVFNNSAERLLNCSAERAIGRPIAELFPAIPVKACLAEAKAALGELVNINSKRLLANIIPIDVDQAVAGAMITIEDVGQIVEMEAAIRSELYSKGLSAEYRFDDIRGTSPQITEAKRIAREYAAIDSTVLISGASGTGKELFAQSIHNASKRRQRPFVAVNCGALPTSLLESELFGYVEGAFTGATKKGKPGLFELAHGGTIFLDEIGEMDRLAQTRLLRVIQERRVMRLGGEKYLPVDVRIMAATHKNLEQQIEDGKFREDLYYRINVLPLALPPLKDRQGDALLIADEFLATYNKRFGRNVVLDEFAQAFIAGNKWPGNIRQVKNLIERLVVTAKDSVITGENLALLFGSQSQETASPVTVANPESSERARLLSVLEETGFNQKEAARRLGIDRSTLYRKLKALNIEIGKKVQHAMQ